MTSRVRGGRGDRDLGTDGPAETRACPRVTRRPIARDRCRPPKVKAKKKPALVRLLKIGILFIRL